MILSVGMGELSTIYSLKENNWAVEDIIVPPHNIGDSNFGGTVSWMNSDLLIGAPNFDTIIYRRSTSGLGHGEFIGKVFHYSINYESWKLFNELFPGPNLSGMEFGLAVSSNQNMAVISGTGTYMIAGYPNYSRTYTYIPNALSTNNSGLFLNKSLNLKDDINDHEYLIGRNVYLSNKFLIYSLLNCTKLEERSFEYNIVRCFYNGKKVG